MVVVDHELLVDVGVRPSPREEHEETSGVGQFISDGKGNFLIL
jgi:hypothetical protein